jgi:hypothetical protein
MFNKDKPLQIFHAYSEREQIQQHIKFTEMKEDWSDDFWLPLESYVAVTTSIFSYEKSLKCKEHFPNKPRTMHRSLPFRFINGRYHNIEKASHIGHSGTR